MTLDLAISPDNVPYIVYEDVTAGNQIVVQRFNGANWEIVGTAGFSAGKAYNTAITFDAGGTPYVSFGDEANGDKITVMKFDGVDWLTVGSAGFSGEKVVSLGRTSTTSIGVAPNGNIYAAYYNNGYLAAKKFGSTISADYQTVCNNELPVVWNGVNYDTTGTYQYASTNAVGCDSTATLFLTVNPLVTGTDTVTACGSYTWIDNTTYTQSNNTATHTILGGALNGCDSIVSLNLTINQPSTGTDTLTACESFTWIDNNTYTQSNNTATHTIVGGTVNGCDSVVTLDLTIKQAATGVDTQTGCKSFTWIDNNTYTHSNNTATHTILGGADNGCDSTVTLDLTIINMNPSVVDNVDFLSPSYSDGYLYEWLDCNSEQLVFTGENFYPNQSGDYKVKITKDGCVETSDCFHFSSVGLEENTIDNFVIYPNPTANILYIDDLKVETIRVLDLNGREVLRKSNTDHIQVNQLSPGSYFVEVNKTMLKLFVKK